MLSWITPLAVFAAVLLTPASLFSQGNAQQIFETCRETVRTIQARSIDRMERLTAECLARIEELQAAGQNDRAREVANRTIESIRTTARQSMTNITEVCQRGIRALRELRAEELATRLETLCNEARRAIATRANQLIERIRAQF